MFFTLVPEKSVKILQRLGKFHKKLEPGLRFFIPFIDQVEHNISLKEDAISINNQAAITKDNVALQIDGVVFYKVVDPEKAVYNIDNYGRALRNLAMTSMRSEIGKINLKRLFLSRAELNESIRKVLSDTTLSWGILCDRYEVLSIEPPSDIKRSMQLEAESERLRRKEVVLSEAKKESDINIAEGYKEADILYAEGLARAIEVITNREKEGLLLISNTIAKYGEDGLASYNYMMSQNYYKTYKKILESAKVSIIPESQGGNSSDSLAIMSMMMNNGYSSNNNTNNVSSSTSSKLSTTTKNNKTNRAFSAEDKVNQWTQSGNAYGNSFNSNSNALLNKLKFDLDKLIDDTTFYPDPSLYRKK